MRLVGLAALMGPCSSIQSHHHLGDPLTPSGTTQPLRLVAWGPHHHPLEALLSIAVPRLEAVAAESSWASVRLARLQLPVVVPVAVVVGTTLTGSLIA